MIKKLYNFQKYEYLFEFLVFTSIIFSTFYMLRLFSLSRLYIIVSLLIFLVLNLIFKNSQFKIFGLYKNIVFLTIFIILLCYLILSNINTLNEKVVSEDIENLGNELDIYYELETNFKKHTNIFTGTYDLNNTYSLKN